MSNDLVVQGEVPQGGVVRLAAKLEDVVEAFKEYQAACERLLIDNDYQKIGNKQFKKKSAWRKLQTAFGISTKIVSKEVAYGEDGRIHHAEFVVRAESPNGRATEAWAGASRVDRKEGGFSHDQDIAATAQTRATSRAIADLIGSGEVSAEEASTEPPQPEVYSQEFIAQSDEFCRAWRRAISLANSKADFGKINDEFKADWARLTDYHQEDMRTEFNKAWAAFKGGPVPEPA